MHEDVSQPALPLRRFGIRRRPRAEALPLSRKRRIVRRIGTILIVLGIVGLAYGATIYFWRDPVTDLYARWKQSQLSAQLDKAFRDYAPAAIVPDAGSADSGGTARAAGATAAVDVALARRAEAENARRYLAALEPGDAVGRIIIPRLGINPVFVNGTRWGPDLSRGPGRYPETSLPGLDKVTAIAGHRTTFGAWFRNIDKLKPGDPIKLVLPYGTFRYSVIKSEIVENDDWSIIQPRGYDELVLSACHPLYSATHRWIVYAKLVRVDMPNGVSYAEPAPTRAQLAATTAKTAGHD